MHPGPPYTELCEWFESYRNPKRDCTNKFEDDNTEDDSQLSEQEKLCTRKCIEEMKLDKALAYIYCKHARWLCKKCRILNDANNACKKCGEPDQASATMLEKWGCVGLSMIRETARHLSVYPCSECGNITKKGEACKSCLLKLIDANKQMEYESEDEESGVYKPYR